MTTWTSFHQKIQQYLCPPGNGVYTIHTAKEQKSFLQNLLYGSDQPEKVERLWKKTLDNLPHTSLPVVLGLCSDNGGGILRGANWGPLFIRQTFYQQGASLPPFFDLGDIRVIPHLLLDEYLNPPFLRKVRKALYGNEESELPVSPLSIAQDFAREFHAHFPDKKLIGLGGDHSVSYPLVSEFFRAKKKQNISAALIHFDAHTDLLPERLGVDICFGSWTYHVLKDLPSPGHLVQIGIRSSGKDQNHWEKNLGIKQYWSRELREKGASRLAEDILAYLSRRQVDEIYVTFDIDALDAQYASATGTPEAGGLAPHEAVIILQELCDRYPLTGADLVEVAPFTRPPIASTGPSSSNHEITTLEPETTLMAAEAICNFFIENMNEK